MARGGGPGSGGRVVVRDLGWNDIKRDVQALRNRGVKVGLRAGGATGEVIEYAAYNEFGTERIPSRPFMRRTADTKRPEIFAAMAGFASAIATGNLRPQQALNQLGLWYVDRIRQTIQSAGAWAEPMSPRTVREKGSSAPLIDTRVMLRSVDHEVE